VLGDICGEDGFEDLIEGIGEQSVGAEVDAEGEGVEWELETVSVTDSIFADEVEKLDLCLAKQIDGLHGVADEKDRTRGIAGPVAYESGDELVLAA
jgi:hypothetical protein